MLESVSQIVTDLINEWEKIMKLSVIAALPSQKTPCLVLGLTEAGFSPVQQSLGREDQEQLKQLLELQEARAELAEHCLIPLAPSSVTSRILIIGLGKKMPMPEKDFRKAFSVTFQALKKTKATHAIIDLQNVNVDNQDIAWQCRQLAMLCEEAFYEFNEFRKAPEQKKMLESIQFLVSKKDEALATQGCREGSAIAGGLTLSKNLANTPPNICTPIFLADAAKKLETASTSEKNKIKTTILDEIEMKNLGMGSLLSVSHGSNNPPRLIVLEYHGAASTERPLTFVGKGITFDTGGNSLKSGEGMIGMKYDMSGGACVMGLMQTVMQLQLPINIVGVIAAAENMPGASATRPEDIVRSMSGQTIEILNTDAEGRLVLCDALTYCKKFNPAVVIDIATLTGAILIALGVHRSGVFSNCEALSHELYKIGEQSGDTVWPMPMDEEYDKTIDSKIADLQNIGKGRNAGSMVAACFLSRFTKDYHWAHLDVAGTATTESRTATGRPLPLLIHYVLHYCHNKKA